MPATGYISLLGHGEQGRVVVATTIDGAPLTAGADGELHALMHLPADRRVQVTIGFASQNRLHPDGCEPVVHDPAHPHLPLEFQLQPLFPRVRGRVTGMTAAELVNAGVTLVSSDEGDERGELTRVQPDGTFELQAQRGNHHLFLIETTVGEWRGVLARQPLILDRDVEGLVLTPEPTAGVPR